MPETTDPSPERPQPEITGRAGPDLTTTSLAQAANQPAGEESSRSFATGGSAAGEPPAPLFAIQDASRLRADWDSVQASFVDEPRQAVEAADRLVASAIKQLAEIFADEKAKLEGQWDRGGDASTEDLRQALRRYRSFFGRVLSV